MISMKPIFLLAVSVCAVISLSVHSEDWIAIHSEEKQKTEYYDADSIKVIDGNIFFWSMVDFKLPVMGVLSRKNYVELNCALGRYRLREQILYEGSRGAGQAYESEIVKAEMVPVSSVAVISEVIDKYCIHSQ